MGKILVFMFFIAGLLYPTFGESRSPKFSCQNHPIHCQIARNNPELSFTYARKLSNIIYKASRKHKIPSDIFTAILKQESNYKLGAINKKSNDYGIAQVNKFNIIKLGLDKDKLLNDLNYSVNAGAKILSWFYKRYGDDDPFWYCRYNVGTGSGKIVMRNCHKYLKKVNRWL